MPADANLRKVLEAVPAHAGDLIEQLSKPSNGSTEKRELLATELVSDLRLYADVQDHVLFPALRKADKTQVPPSIAINDNAQLRARIAELEVQRKDGEDFSKVVSALKKELEDQLRREQELLPTLIKALDEAEAQRIADEINGVVRESANAKSKRADTTSFGGWFAKANEAPAIAAPLTASATEWKRVWDHCLAQQAVMLQISSSAGDAAAIVAHEISDLTLGRLNATTELVAALMADMKPDAMPDAVLGTVHQWLNDDADRTVRSAIRLTETALTSASAIAAAACSSLSASPITDMASVAPVM